MCLGMHALHALLACNTVCGLFLLLLFIPTLLQYRLQGACCYVAELHPHVHGYHCRDPAVPCFGKRLCYSSRVCRVCIGVQVAQSALVCGREAPSIGSIIGLDVLLHAHGRCLASRHAGCMTISSADGAVAGLGLVCRPLLCSLSVPKTVLR